MPRIPFVPWLLKLAIRVAIIAAIASSVSEAKKSIDTFRGHVQSHQMQLAAE